MYPNTRSIWVRSYPDHPDCIMKRQNWCSTMTLPKSTPPSGPRKNTIGAGRDLSNLKVSVLASDHHPWSAKTKEKKKTKKDKSIGVMAWSVIFWPMDPTMDHNVVVTKIWIGRIGPRSYCVGDLSNLKITRAGLELRLKPTMDQISPWCPEVDSPSRLWTVSL